MKEYQMVNAARRLLGLDETRLIIDMFHHMEHVPIEINDPKLKIDDGLKGFATDHQGKLIVCVRDTMKASRKLTTLSHELVHVVQMLSGRLKSNPATNIVIFDGKAYSGSMPYEKMPWEIEARQLQGSMEARLKMEMNNE